MSDDEKPMELQSSASTYATPLQTPPSLPYHWDGECHLVLNDNFYCHSPAGEHPSLKDDMDFDVNGSYEKVDAGLDEVQSVSTMETGNEQAVPVPAPMEETYESVFGDSVLPASKKVQNLDDQLDFIMESSKKHAKLASSEAKHKRSRKTPAQLDVLCQELGNCQTVDKDKMKYIADKTGLTEIQVYKWYWDRKPKA